MNAHFRLKLDMTGCRCLGEVKEPDFGRTYRSICDECAKPVRECVWLLYGKPYPRTEYYVKRAVYEKDRTYAVYVVTGCYEYEPPLLEEV